MAELFSLSLFFGGFSPLLPFAQVSPDAAEEEENSAKTRICSLCGSSLDLFWLPDRFHLRIRSLRSGLWIWKSLAADAARTRFRLLVLRKDLRGF